MNAQIDFLKRCKELGLQGGKLSNWLDEIESLRAENSALKEQVVTLEKLQGVALIESLCAEIERLKDLCTTMDGQLGKRPCQNNRCLEYNRLAAELAKYRDAPVVVWRTHPFDYGIGHKGVYASSHFKEQGDAWERKGWKVEHLIVKPGEEK